MGKTEVILVSTLTTVQKIQVIDGKIANAEVPFTLFNGHRPEELKKYLQKRNILLGWRKLSQ